MKTNLIVMGFTSIKAHQLRCRQSPGSQNWTAFTFSFVIIWDERCLKKSFDLLYLKNTHQGIVSTTKSISKNFERKEGQTQESFL